MKKHLSNKARLLRPADAFVPLAYLAACLMGRNGLAGVAWCLGTLASIGGAISSGALRLAFARQPSMRLARGSTLLALLLQPIGALIAVGWCAIRGNPGALWPVILAVLSLNIEHVFYEYLYSFGDRRSAIMSQLLCAVLWLAGLMLSTPAGNSNATAWNPLFLAGCAALSALASGLVALVLGDGLKGRRNAQLIRSAPQAMLHTLLYPLASLGIVLWIRPMEGSNPLETPLLAAFFAGLTLYELCKTPFRRHGREIVPFIRALAITAVASAAILVIDRMLPLRQISTPSGIVNSLLTTLPLMAWALLLAALCAFVLFGTVKREV